MCLYQNAPLKSTPTFFLPFLDKFGQIKFNLHGDLIGRIAIKLFILYAAREKRTFRPREISMLALHW